MRPKISTAHSWKRVACITTLLLLSTLPGLAQVGIASHDDQQPSTYPGQTQDNRAETVWDQQQRKAMEKKQNQQRQQDIRKDTEKLLELATELKQAVDKSNENTLSMDVVHKAEEIEKLAKSVKNKMKGP